MKNSFEITFEDFKGPLDLLLHLLEKNKVDIYDIPIIEITKQYIDYIEKVENKLTVASEFLVMASTLISIKTRMLLPKHDEDEEDPRTELVQQLLEYRCFKEIGEKLGQFQGEGQKAIIKNATIPEEVKKFEYKPNVDDLFKNVDIHELEKIFTEVLRRAKDRIDTLRHDFNSVKEDKWTVEEMILNLRKEIDGTKKRRLSEILNKCKSKLHIVVAFLALLEMIKFGEVKIVSIDCDEVEVIGG